VLVGFDAVSNLAGSRRSDVEEFLRLLGYRPVRSVFPTKGESAFMYFPDHDYAFVTGVEATVFQDRQEVNVHTRTRVWRSKADTDTHNDTLRQLNKRFGGAFHSDVGAGRYFIYDGPDRRDAEAGAYRAFSIFEDNHSSAGLFVQNIPAKDSSYRAMPLELRFAYPPVNAANMVVPFFVAIVEEYLRSTFVALLRYSRAREAILKNVKMTFAEAVHIRDTNALIEEEAARKISFQDLAQVQRHFKALNDKYDIGGWLRFPYRGRKESLHATLERLIQQRHSFVHRARLSGNYGHIEAERDLNSIRVAVTRIYEKLISLNGWAREDAG